MGATRKLQSEIDKVLKKVHEGVEVFDSIWNKVYDTENANQKEKFEADLKKEIKKLQRYRDQIKTWIQSSEIKDKKVAANYEQYLLDARKMIEREMERFKVCEKETKTKAFSKEGLGQQPKTDPKEKAKAETREWLNNMVDELQSGIDTFESEMEGLASKKGRNRPPRLVHLEESAARHKSHVMKLELILRLLDNDELSAEQVNDIKDLVEDYLERNQEDFDEFADVDEIYSQLPLEKMEAMEALDAVPSVPSAVIVKEKAAVAAASGVTTNGGSLKPSLPAVTVAATASSAAAVSQASSASSSTLEDATSEDRTPAIPVVISPTTSSAMQPDIASSPTTARPVATPPGLLARTQKTASSVVQSSPISIVKAKEDDLNRRTSGGDGGLSRSFGRPTPSSSPAPQASNVTLSVPSNTTSPVATAAEAAKRNLIDPTQLSSPLSTQRAFGGKLGDATDAADTSNRGGQWREPGQIQRTEFTPDHKQKFLQKLQQTNVSSLLSTPGLPHLASPSPKQQSSPSALVQQTFLQQQQQQQSPPAQMPQSPIPQVGPQSQALSGTQSQPQGVSVQTQLPTAAKDIVSQPDAVLTRNLEQRQQSPLRADEGSSETSAFTRNLTLNEDDLKNADTFDVAVQGPGTLAEFSQLSREADFASGQQVPPTPTSSGPGVIGRKELGAIGDNLPTSSQQYDHSLNLQLLEAAYRHLPQPKDSERPRSYVPRTPAMTPASYPQAPAQFIDNPSLWDKFETDVLFFSFYYQQGTYQQYLAAKELKKQSWRYHKKYNTWFQRHEEPKVTSDDFEQGTYVYFDFHIVEDLQQGWVQRIKTEFTFEYSFLEDELQVN